MTLTAKTCVKAAGGILAGLAVILLAAVLGFDYLDRRYPPDLTQAGVVSQEVHDAEGRLLRAYLTPAGFLRLPTTVADVDPRYIEMLIAYEDKRFYRHRGVDPLALLRALWQAGSHGRIISGASTLTMQTARLLEPRPRTLTSKLVEMFRAIQLERRFSKAEILSFYLTLAPFGGNREGVRAAALSYFGRPPRNLTAGEAAILVALPQSPTRLRPDRHPQAVRVARDKILRRVAAAMAFGPADLKRATTEVVEAKLHPVPFHAPHLADRLAAGAPAARVVTSTLDRTLQARLEALARGYARTLGRQTSVALLVVENSSRKVRAYLGSADFSDDKRQGQVDVIQALRSPGSTLKPLFYGLAFDRGIAHPATLVDDVPTQFGNYRPANFRSEYHGRVTLAEALQLSLNVPAVALLDRLGPVAVTEQLRQAGLRLEFGGADIRPGLALALGGVGITLEDLLRLYAAFADDGHPRALSYLEAPEPILGAGPQADGNALLGGRARGYLGEILRSLQAPGRVRADGNRKRAVAFKTGTSYGFRDAWAIGYDAVHSVGVWVGRADGTPNPGRYGAATAAPLLFQVFDQLPPSGPAHAGEAPPLLDADNLPPGLRYLDRSMLVASARSSEPPPRLLFPPDRSLLDMPGSGGVLVLEAEGGRRPLSWIVNGVPLASRQGRRRVQWLPDGPGFSEILVVDALGRRVRAEIELRSPGTTRQASHALTGTSFAEVPGAN